MTVIVRCMELKRFEQILNDKEIMCKNKKSHQSHLQVRPLNEIIGIKVTIKIKVTTKGIIKVTIKGIIKVTTKVTVK